MEKEIKLNMYDSFQCIADKCSITCCQEWKIEVDKATRKKWRKLKLEQDQTRGLNHFITQKDGTDVIQLNHENKCPFLNEQKLCKLVEQFGDDVLSRTCATFPREIHKFESHTEYSLVSCCPEVIDMLEKLERIEFVGNTDVLNENHLFRIRELLIRILQNKHYSIPKALMICFYMLQELYEKDEMSIEMLEHYQYEAVAVHLAEEIDKMEFHRSNTFWERNELFLDLAENYRNEKLYVNYLEPIGLLAEELEENYDEEEQECDANAFQSELLKYEHLFRNYLAAELFTNCFIPDSDFESMIIMFQWIAMEYVMIKHAIYLDWIANDRSELTYTRVRDYMVIVSRMTGYDQEDIEEYFENCFESLIWEWGYLALLSGNDVI